MIVLDSGSKYFQIFLGGAVTTTELAYSVNWEDTPPGSKPSALNFPGSAQGSTTGATALSIVTPITPQLGLRKITSVCVNNTDTVAQTVGLRVLDTSTSVGPVFFKATLQTAETLVYEDGYGFSVLDSGGALKSQAAATSSATSIAQLLATSAWSVLQQIAAPASVLSVSVQASSLAAAVLPASVNSVSSQASSMAALIPASVSSAASLGLLVSTQQSGASVQSFTSTTWSTASSAVSRLKASFTW